MPHRARKWLLVSAAVVVTLATLAWAARRAMQHVPKFYSEARSEDAAVDRESSHAMVRKMTALAGDALHSGPWQAVFTSQQINGYLAVDLPEKHPHLLPPQAHDPRVVVRADGVYVGWRFDGGWRSTIYSLCVVPYVASPNVLALRIRRIRAGAIPVPLGEVVDGLSAAAGKSGVRLQWRQEDGDPVALVELPAIETDSATELVLESISLEDGAIALSGHTRPRTATASPPTASLPGIVPPGARLGDHSAASENRQR